MADIRKHFTSFHITENGGRHLLQALDRYKAELFAGMDLADGLVRELFDELTECQKQIAIELRSLRDLRERDEREAASLDELDI